MTRILTDGDIDSVPLRVFIDAVRAQIIADAAGAVVAPPRHVAGFGDGDLVFTIGGTHDLAGFRAYQTFAKPGNPQDDQVVAAWHQDGGALAGIAVGNRLGALRTGVIGAVAVDLMAPSAARTLGVVGTGRQAETQVLAVSEVRDFSDIRVYGRRRDALETFVTEISRKIGKPVRAAASAREAVRGADVVILATTSESPVVEPSWIAPNAHVSTLGPKSATAHELPLALADRASLIATDSPQQIRAMGDGHMLGGLPAYRRIEHLGALPGFDHDGDAGIRLFLSIGLAGTEVACLGAALNYLSS